jgi:hypothetical protein
MSEDVTTNNNASTNQPLHPEGGPGENKSLPYLKEEILYTAFSLETVPQQIRDWQYEGEDSLSALGGIVQELRNAQEHLMEAKLRFDLNLPPPVEIAFHDDSSLMYHFRDIVREISKERDEWGDYADLGVLSAHMQRMVSLDPKTECAEELVYESARVTLWFRNNGFPSEVTKPLAKFWDEAVRETNNYPQPISMHQWPGCNRPPKAG